MAKNLEAIALLDISYLYTCAQYNYSNLIDFVYVFVADVWPPTRVKATFHHHFISLGGGGRGGGVKDIFNMHDQESTKTARQNYIIIMYTMFLRNERKAAAS